MSAGRASGSITSPAMLRRGQVSSIIWMPTPSGFTLEPVGLRQGQIIAQPESAAEPELTHDSSANALIRRYHSLNS